MATFGHTPRASNERTVNLLYFTENIDGSNTFTRGVQARGQLWAHPPHQQAESQSRRVGRRPENHCV